MADSNDSGEKTEKATPKKLRDAREKGDIPKSKDLTSTIGLILSAIVIWFAAVYTVPKFADLMSTALQASTDDFPTVAAQIGKQALDLFVLSSLLIIIPVAALSLFIEFVQVGPLLAIDKVKPDLTKLNPVSGFKRMFSADNFFELIKSIVKTSAILFFCWLAIDAILPDLVFLPASEPGNVVGALFDLTLYIVGASLLFLLLFTAIDVSYQHYAFAKKMKMSLHDIKQEHKNTEGDPLIKSHRRQTAQEWAQEGASQAAGDASALVVNPTHIAVAIRFDRDLDDVPVVTAVGEHEVAQAMRDSAKRNHVPVVRNIKLARTLLATATEGEMVPRDLFDVVAEVILWAQSVSERVQHEKTYNFVPWDGDLSSAPGEDLTSYPENAVTANAPVNTD